VRAVGGYTAEAHVLSQMAFGQKLEVINRLYAHQITASDADGHACLAEVTGVEAFVPTRFSEVVKAFVHTSQGILSDVPDIWAFETSPYEQERFDQMCAVLAQACREDSPASILEIGACEGAMTRRLRTLFPGAKICAVEVNPVFGQRLRDRLGNDPDIDIVEASILDVPLSADLVLLAEILYYVPEHLMDILAAVRAKYLLTSYVGNFDDQVSLGLRRCGWHDVLSVQVAPRLEPVDGRTSFLIVRRPGGNIRLWKLA
jgi:Nodulation protein S (NodS)